MRTDFSHTMRLLANPVHRARILQRAYKQRVLEWEKIVEKASLNPHILIPIEPRRPDIRNCLCTLMQITPDDLTPEQLTEINDIFSL